jgi:hypothetical protein
MSRSFSSGPGDPTKSCIGVLISNHRNHTDALIAELEYLDGNKNARTRLVEMVRFLEPGSLVDPRCDLKPVER